MDNRTLATEVARWILNQQPNGEGLVAVLCSQGGGDLQKEAWNRLCELRADRTELVRIIKKGNAAAEWAAAELMRRESCRCEDLVLVAVHVSALRADAWKRLLSLAPQMALEGALKILEDLK